MKKMFIVLSIVVGLVVIGNLGYYLYWSLNPKPTEVAKVTQEIQEEKDINALNDDVNSLDDLDLSEVGNIEASLSEIDLSGI